MAVIIDSVIHPTPVALAVAPKPAAKAAPPMISPPVAAAATQTRALESLQTSTALGSAWQTALTSSAPSTQTSAPEPGTTNSTVTAVAASAPAASSALTLRFMRSQLPSAPLAQPVTVDTVTALATSTPINPNITLSAVVPDFPSTRTPVGPATPAEVASNLSLGLRQAMPSFQRLLPGVAPLDPLVNLPAAQQDNLPPAWKALLPGSSPNGLEKSPLLAPAAPDPETRLLPRTLAPLNKTNPTGLPDTRFPGDPPLAVATPVARTGDIATPEQPGRATIPSVAAAGSHPRSGNQPGTPSATTSAHTENSTAPAGASKLPQPDPSTTRAGNSTARPSTPAELDKTALPGQATRRAAAVPVDPNKNPQTSQAIGSGANPGKTTGNQPSEPEATKPAVRIGNPAVTAESGQSPQAGQLFSQTAAASDPASDSGGNPGKQNPQTPLSVQANTPARSGSAASPVDPNKTPTAAQPAGTPPARGGNSAPSVDLTSQTAPSSSTGPNASRPTGTQNPQPTVGNSTVSAENGKGPQSGPAGTRASVPAEPGRAPAGQTPDPGVLGSNSQPVAAKPADTGAALPATRNLSPVDSLPAPRTAAPTDSATVPSSNATAARVAPLDSVKGSPSSQPAARPTGLTEPSNNASKSPTSPTSEPGVRTSSFPTAADPPNSAPSSAPIATSVGRVNPQTETVAGKAADTRATIPQDLAKNAQPVQAAVPVARISPDTRANPPQDLAKTAQPVQAAIPVDRLNPTEPATGKAADTRATLPQDLAKNAQPVQATAPVARVSPDTRATIPQDLAKSLQPVQATVPVARVSPAARTTSQDLVKVPSTMQKHAAGPDLRFPGDVRPFFDWSRLEEPTHHKESEEETRPKAEPERKREPEKVAQVKEKAIEAPKAPETKAQQPQRQQQRAISVGSGGGEKEAGGPSAAERAETVKKMSEQFQLAPSKPEMQRNAPLLPPLPGTTSAKENSSERPAKNESRPETGPLLEAGHEKAETTQNQRRTPHETERGPAFQPAKSEAPQREQSELPQSHTSHSESEGRGNQEKPGEEMQQRSDRGERQPRRRQNHQEADQDDEEALLEFEERAS
ncbi:MAG: hypothetical protein J0I12_05190 [Candidatus Eremiobacteraeota bacterium]|nr:hypothetical protein [Candidatus Eremiobacteraeota bacterium]